MLIKIINCVSLAILHTEVTVLELLLNMCFTDYRDYLLVVVYWHFFFPLHSRNYFISVKGKKRERDRLLRVKK